jgi:lipid II:glycine glycyltransferase (peptidoglycan interpeptide bridge formation enzyme)
VKPFIPLTTGYSLRLDLTKSFETLADRFKPRHRAYVRQTLNQVECRAGNDSRFAEEFLRLHNEMTTRKGLSAHRISQREVAALCEQLAEQAVIFTGYVNDEPLTSYLVVNSGTKAFYLMAATGQKGREIRASYGVFSHLLQYLQNSGMTEFDLGGMDPNSPGARGVNQFKKGFGGELVQYVGEWEWSTASWFRWAVNFGIWYRGKRL